MLSEFYDCCKIERIKCEIKWMNNEMLLFVNLYYVASIDVI